MSDRVIIFDTTLRDGEQSPGASMNAAEKLRLATQLEKLGGRLGIRGNPALPSRAASALAEHLTRRGYTGQVRIEANKP